jgi:hypothetical protein
MATPISNYRLTESEKKKLKFYGFNSESRGIRALIEVADSFGPKVIREEIKKGNLGIKDK